ncbi:hypothetical protein OIU78_001848 [Salix suchowensis]|nr:hypothetical protein OIU78_001848 [Salix suchowensis]
MATLTGLVSGSIILVYKFMVLNMVLEHMIMRQRGFLRLSRSNARDLCLGNLY